MGRIIEDAVVRWHTDTTDLDLRHSKSINMRDAKLEPDNTWMTGPSMSERRVGAGSVGNMKSVGKALIVKAYVSA